MGLLLASFSRQPREATVGHVDPRFRHLYRETIPQHLRSECGWTTHHKSELMEPNFYVVREHNE